MDREYSSRANWPRRAKGFWLEEISESTDTGRHDIITSKVVVDRDTVYFYVETKDVLTPHTGTNWMLLLIDADLNPGNGWSGYDYLIERSDLPVH